MTSSRTDDIHRLNHDSGQTGFGTQPVTWHFDENSDTTVVHSFRCFLGRFGSKYRSNVTGIIYNDKMDDFDIPVTPYSPSPFNFPVPNKRPFSSISPTILTNDNGDVQLGIGASCGKRITTTMSLVCLMASYFEHEQMNGRKVHPPYRSYSEVYYFLVIFRSRYKNKWSKTQMKLFFSIYCDIILVRLGPIHICSLRIPVALTIAWFQTMKD